MPEKIVHFLFWPWFSSQKYDVVGWFAYMSFGKGICLIAVLSLLFVFVEKKIIGRKPEDARPPRFLQISARVLLWLVAIGFFGAMLNTLTKARTDSMSVYVQKTTEWAMVDSRHRLGDAGTPIFSDYLSVNRSPLLRFLFPWHNYASPGDLMIAACVIFSWWLAIILAAWMPLFAAREIFAKPPPRKD